MWTIEGDTLKSNHSKLLTYTWGLEEIPKTIPKSFYIKDTTKCTGITWYNLPVQNTNANRQNKAKSPKNSEATNLGTRNKRQIPPKCLALTHDFTHQPVKDEPTPKWKMEKTKQKNVFRLYFKEEGKNKTYVSATTVENELVSKQDCKGILAANVENFRTFEGNTKKVLTVLLGFFVATIVKRWWDQTSKIPRLEKLAISLNAIMQEGKTLTYKKIT